HEVCQLAPDVGPVRGEPLLSGPAQIPRDSGHLPHQRRIGEWPVHGFAVTSFDWPMEAQPRARSSVPGDVSTCALGWEDAGPWHRIRSRMPQARLGGAPEPSAEPAALPEGVA